MMCRVLTSDAKGLRLVRLGLKELRPDLLYVCKGAPGCPQERSPAQNPRQCSSANCSAAMATKHAKGSQG